MNEEKILKISLYLDGLLEGSQKEDLEKLLAGDKEAEELYRDMKKNREFFMDEEKEKTPPENFSAEIMEKIKKEKAGQKKGGVKKKFVLRPWMSLAAAVLLLLAANPSIFRLPMMGSQESPKEALYEEAGDFSDSGRSVSAAGGEVNMMKTFDADIASPEVSAYELEQDEGFADGKMSEAVYERKIIRSGYIYFTTENYDSTVKEIKDMVSDAGGYVASENSYVYDNERGLQQGNFSVRIDDGFFEGFMDNLEDFGDVINRNANSYDASEEYYDLDSRVSALRVKEERLLALLEKSGDLKDVLEIERELADTRAQLENYERQKLRIDSRSSLATVEIEIREISDPASELGGNGSPGLGERFLEALEDSLDSMLAAGISLVIMAGRILPFAAAAVILVFLFRMFFLKR